LVEYKAILFDLDGTLIESRVDFLGMRKALIYYFKEKLGIHALTPELTTVKILEHALLFLWNKHAGEDIVFKVMKDISSIMDTYEKKAVETIRPVPEARDALLKAKKLGFKTAVITRAGIKYAERALLKTGLYELIDAIEARENPFTAKPNPLSIWRLCSKLQIKPWEAVLIGDHPIDLECARRVNAGFIALVSEKNISRFSGINVKMKAYTLLDAVDKASRLVTHNEDTG